MTASSKLVQLFGQLGQSTERQSNNNIDEPQNASVAHQRDAEFDMALAVAQVVDTNLDPGRVHQQFEIMVQPLLQSQHVSVDELLRFFKKLGFGRSALTRVMPEHSNIAWVMDNREGLPIVLAALLITCARRCALDAYGINFPGHFLVNMAGQLVDPLGLQEITPDSLQLPQVDESARKRLLQSTSASAFGLRMLNNLKAQYINKQDWLGALDLVDYQAALGGHDTVVLASLEFERGEFWEKLGAYAVAGQAFTRCADMSELPDLAKQARQRAQQLLGRSETLH